MTTEEVKAKPVEAKAKVKKVADTFLEGIDVPSEP